MKKWYNFLVIGLLAFSVSGCATVTTSRFQKVSVDSTPQGADVVLSDGQKGVTPCFFNMRRNKKYIVKMYKEGYTTAEITLKKSICWSTAGNILITGPIGLGIDTLTGAICKIIPENVHIDLIAQSGKDIIPQ